MQSLQNLSFYVKSDPGPLWLKMPVTSLCVYKNTRTFYPSLGGPMDATQPSSFGKESQSSFYREIIFN